MGDVEQCFQLIADDMKTNPQRCQWLYDTFKACYFKEIKDLKENDLVKAKSAMGLIQCVYRSVEDLIKCTNGAEVEVDLLYVTKDILEEPLRVTLEQLDPKTQTLVSLAIKQSPYYCSFIVPTPKKQDN